MTPAQLRADPWAFGPWCWVVEKVALFGRPIPCRGMQGLWPTTPPGNARPSSLEKALAEVAGAPVLSALTVLQPFATAIAAGVKKVENRPWRRDIPVGGLWLGLHAGKAWYDGEQRSRLLVRVWSRPPEEHHLFAEYPVWPECPAFEAFPRGVMLGAMRISACLRYPDDRKATGGHHG